MRLLPAVVIAAGIVIWIVIPAKEEPVRYVPNAVSGELTPTMSTTDVSTLISDSGYTKYHVTSPLWQMFEDAENPFWKFPEGLELEQYDEQLNPRSSVVCDSAIYFSRSRLWQLDGNVVMVSTSADSFLTQQLFWDQNTRKMYSDSFIHIVRSDRIIEGYGFESDQNMESYTVRKPTAILPAERMPGSRRTDSTRTATPERDTTAAAVPAATTAPAGPAAPAKRGKHPEPARFITRTESADTAARPARQTPQRIRRRDV